MTINGGGNNVIFQGEVLNLVINGSSNKIQATHRKAMLTNVVFNGAKNVIRVGAHSANVCSIQNGENNRILVEDGRGGRERTNNNNNNSRSGNTFNFGNSNISINFNGGHSGGQNINPNQIMDIINSVTSGFNMNLNIPGFSDQSSGGFYSGTQARNYEVEEEDEEDENDNDNDSGDDENSESGNEEDEEFTRKKKKYILELDEFQYKHIQKFSALKEDKCAICLIKFKGVDIIKELPCKHIFHKNCVLKWLSKSNNCPLCKHDISNEIKNVNLSEGDEESDIY